MLIILSRKADNLSAEYPLTHSVLSKNKIAYFNKKLIILIFEKCIAIAVIIVIWQALPTLGFIDPFLLPSFSAVLESLGKLFLSGEMFTHMGASLERSGVGFLVAVTFAITVGVLMGWFKSFERIMDPLIQACRSTSTLALYPVFILFFGLGGLAQVSIIIWGTMWPTLLNTINGVKNVDPQLIKVARSMGVSKPALFYKVVFPMALPSIVAGLRLSAATSLLMLVAAEMLGADRGLGFMIFYYQEKYAIANMYGGIITISVLGFSVNFLLIKLEKRLTFWKEKIVKA